MTTMRIRKSGKIYLIDEYVTNGDRSRYITGTKSFDDPKDAERYLVDLGFKKHGDEWKKP